MKTNEEYKFFKGKKEDQLGQFGRKRPNVKDPDEPFLSINKGKYKYGKNQLEILNCLHLTMEDINYFKTKLSTIEKSNFYKHLEIYNEFGINEYDEKSRYYWIYLSTDADSDDRIIFLPNENFTIVKFGGKKKFLHKENSPDLIGITDYIFNILDKERIDSIDQYNKRKSDIYKEFISDDIEISDEEITPLGPGRKKRKKENWYNDTSTFDSYHFNNLKTFEKFTKNINI